MTDKLTLPATLEDSKFIPGNKYPPFPPVHLPDRNWPNKTISKAPIWCSVDLRDGNQALVNPMDVSQKLRMFNLLVQLGFREIEVGFPSASDIEFNFMRELVKQGLLKNGIIPQSLVQSREHLIRRTFQAIEGMEHAIIHLYNSTSTLQRKVVFNLDREGIKDIAISGTRLIRELADKTETKITFEYSPESFTGTELDYALEVCEAVIETWNPSPQDKMIINLPATVEMSTPNIYADQIEWFIRNLSRRESVVLSLHTHNDRGTGIAASELGLLAGADRIEGTLFGNGERTGNVDIVTLALNLFTQGVPPNLDFRDLPSVVKTYEDCTGMTVHERHPYAGDLVFTAFSGSHQDAINKGMAAWKKRPEGPWAVPYIPVDPADIGRTYDAIVRINSQSGKGGVAFVMEQEFGCILPKAMQPELSSAVQKRSDSVARELQAKEIWAIFEEEFLSLDEPLRLKSFKSEKIQQEGDDVLCTITLVANGEKFNLEASGNGPIDAAKNALLKLGTPAFNVIYYLEHALSAGADSKAIAYIQVGNSGFESRFGVGIDQDITMASIKALLSAANRWLRQHSNPFGT